MRTHFAACEASAGSGISLQSRLNGGGRGIRTPGTLSGTTVFKTVCFNHSHIPPSATAVYFCTSLQHAVPGTNRDRGQALRAFAITRKRCVGIVDAQLMQSEGARMKLHHLIEMGEKIGDAVVPGIGMIFVRDALFEELLV